MTTKRKLIVTGVGSLICLAASGGALVLLQISMAESWGTQMQLFPFRPWTGVMASGWDVLAEMCGCAASVFLLAAIILTAIFGWTFFRRRRQGGGTHAA